MIDGNLVTGGGVTASIDVALKLAAEIAGADTARLIQLSLEYDPQPPFQSGHPKLADPSLVERMLQTAEPARERRRLQVAKAGAALAYN